MQDGTTDGERSGYIPLTNYPFLPLMIGREKWPGVQEVE